MRILQRAWLLIGLVLLIRPTRVRGRADGDYYPFYLAERNESQMLYETCKGIAARSTAISLADVRTRLRCT